MLVSTAVMCLALNIYHEARGEPTQGQKAVAMVVMNRSQNAPVLVCRETFAPSQFSWTTGSRKTKYGWILPKHLVPTNDEAWRKSKKLAQQALDGRLNGQTRDCTHYHATYVKPAWSRQMRLVAQIGQHRFYVKA